MGIVARENGFAGRELAVIFVGSYCRVWCKAKLSLRSKRGW
jgi:hypothetical protein